MRVSTLVLRFVLQNLHIFLRSRSVSVVCFEWVRALFHQKWIGCLSLCWAESLFSRRTIFRDHQPREAILSFLMIIVTEYNKYSLLHQQTRIQIPSPNCEFYTQTRIRNAPRSRAFESSTLLRFSLVVLFLLRERERERIKKAQWRWGSNRRRHRNTRA